MALQTDHAGTAGTNHFQFDALAQTEFLQALHMFAAADDFGDDAALTIRKAMEGDMLFKSGSHDVF